MYIVLRHTNWTRQSVITAWLQLGNFGDVWQLCVRTEPPYRALQFQCFFFTRWQKIWPCSFPITHSFWVTRFFTLFAIRSHTNRTQLTYDTSEKADFRRESSNSEIMIMISCHGPQSGSQQKTEFFEFPNR